MSSATSADDPAALSLDQVIQDVANFAADMDIKSNEGLEQGLFRLHYEGGLSKTWDDMTVAERKIINKLSDQLVNTDGVTNQERINLLKNVAAGFVQNTWSKTGISV